MDYRSLESDRMIDTADGFADTTSSLDSCR